MNETIDTLLNHRSIRQFTGEPVPAEKLDAILDVAMRTSTSRGFQHAALIRVTDPDKKKVIAEIGTQPYLADAPELFIGIVDTRRSRRILEEKGLPTAPAHSAESFREGFTDCILMIQNMTAAAESLGLGVTQLGSPLRDYPRLIELLELPELTFPVLGVMFGIPAQEPQLKPRMPKKFRVMENSYVEPESWMDALAEYDQEMQTYYDLRDTNRRVDAFTTQVAAKLDETQVDKRFTTHAKAQGFEL